MTEVNKKNRENLGVNDLILLCEEKDIKVDVDDGRDELLKNLGKKSDS